MHDPSKSRGGWARRLPILLIALVAIVGVITLRDWFTFDTLADNRDRLLALRDAHYLPTVLAFVLAYAVVVAFSLPGALLMTLTGGFLFSTFPGVLYNVTGATMGSICVFLAARLGFGDQLAARMSASEGLVRRVKTGIDRNKWEMLFLIRLIPVFPFFVANLIPSIMGVALWIFVVTTFLGIIPGALVYTAVGAGLGEVFDRGERPDLGIIFEPQILLTIVGLCILAALPAAYRALRGRKEV